MDVQAQLNAIVGAAIQAMATAGVAPERLGAFAAEYREHVAKVLGGVPRPSEPDLIGVVKTAVREALAEGHGQNPGAPQQASSSMVSPDGVRRVYVSIAGQRTSVCIPESVYGALVDSAGGSARQAKQHIEAVAQQAPANLSNRSAWITQRLRSLPSLSALPASAFSQTH